MIGVPLRPSPQNTFPTKHTTKHTTKHIPHRTHSPQNTFPTEHIPHRTHSPQNTPQTTSGASVNATSATALCNTAAHLAAARGHMPALEVLLSHGAHVDARDNDRKTPLHEAAAGGHLQCVLLLMAHGADSRAADKVCVMLGVVYIYGGVHTHQNHYIPLCMASHAHHHVCTHMYHHVPTHTT